MESKGNRTKYFSFISYSHKDSEMAKWLQHEFEYYELPATLFEERKDLRKEDLPESFRPVFRDEDELAGGELKPQISEALANSEYLIVICSPNSAQSKYVDNEIREFLSLSQENKRRIFPLIIDGKPHQDQKHKGNECFSKTLLKLSEDKLDPIELIAGDIHATGRDHAFVKVLAGMLREKQISFSDLWDRYAIEKAEKERKEREEKEKLQIAQSRFVSEKAIKIAEEDSYLARKLVVEVIPSFKNPDRPYIPEVEHALRIACQKNNTYLYGFDNNSVLAIFDITGKYVISAFPDGFLCVWNMYDGKLIKKLKVSNTAISSVALSPNGEFIAVASLRKGIISIIDVREWEILKVLGGSPDNIINQIAYHPDGNRIAAAYSSGEVDIWDIKKESIIKTIKAHEAPVFSITYSWDGNIIITGSKDKTIRIFNPDTGVNINTLIGHKGWIKKVSVSFDDKYIFSASDDKTIRKWDVENGKLIKVLEGHVGGITCAALGRNNKFLVSASIWDQTLRIWDVENGVNIKTYKDITDIHSLAFSQDGRYFVSTSHEKRIRIWDTSYTMTNNISIKGEHWCIPKIAHFSPDNTKMMYVDGLYNWEDRLYNIKIVNVATGSISNIIKGHSKEIVSANYNKDGSKIVSSSFDRNIIIWDAINGDIVLKIKMEPYGLESLVIFSNDGNRLISTVTYEKVVKIRDANTGAVVKTLSGHTGDIRYVSISHDDKYIVSAARDNMIIIWDSITGDIIKTLNSDKNVKMVLFSPNDNNVLSVSDEVVNIWDINSGQIIQSFVGHTSPINSAVYNLDGSKILTASIDKSMKIWDTRSGILLQTIEIPFGSIKYAAFNSVGNKIVSASSDGVVRIWDIPSLQDLITQTYERFKDNPLTPEERRKYYLE